MTDKEKTEIIGTVLLEVGNLIEGFCVRGDYDGQDRYSEQSMQSAFEDLGKVIQNRAQEILG